MFPNSLLNNKKRLIFFVLFTAVFFVTSCQKTNELEPIKNISADLSESNLTRSNHPNIILILGDDIGYEIPTVDGGRSYNTPNINFLAHNGMRFRQCYASANCSPARFMLLTGKYNFRNYTDWGIMDRSQRTIGNMLREANYETCYVGKWQLDGGDVSIRTFGFNKYSVWLPYKVFPEEADGSRYKSPPIYESGVFLPAKQTANKYSVDIFTRYALNFIENNKEKPFFLYYSLPLCHFPFTPTPDDPEYATWDYTKSNTKFFTGMVRYLDKQVKLLRDKIESLGLQNNTIFIFTGDNGAPKPITSEFRDKMISGEKGLTTIHGTRVPLIFYCPAHISPGTITDQLLDFTDFMPTLANIAGIPIPTKYGILDGKTFYPVLKRSISSSRNYVFNHFCPSPTTEKPIRYVQNKKYKLYEDGKFYNIALDVEEKSPISFGQLTSEELQTKKDFKEILNQMHK